MESIGDNEGASTHLEPHANKLESNLSLAVGQIRYMYFWVHPQWVKGWLGSWEREIDKYEAFFRRVSSVSRVGVTQLPFINSDYLGLEQYEKFLRALEQVNHYATVLIGARYTVWDRKFFDGGDAQQVAKLVDQFRLQVADQSAFVADKDAFFSKQPKHLARAMVFGKERDTCPLYQAYSSQLHKVSAVVKYFSDEMPPDRSPPNEKDQSTLLYDGIYVSPK
ncbi:hypothetical protein HZA38_01205 [Candidatus Peregrinibacteria bacterium]|nr:hypothetical protein [Candidatus Peregrinibacteria bacterium]